MGPPKFGTVVWNFSSEVVAFSCGKWDGALSAHQAELMAIKEGLSFVHNWSLSIEIAEYDAINVVNEVHSCASKSFLGAIVMDIV